MLGALIVPTLVAVVWFSVLGGAGLYRQFFTDNPMVPEGGELDANIALFDLVGAFAGPLASVLSVCILILVTLFFVTSSDSGSLVVDMLSSGGHPNPPIWSRVMWSVLEGGVAIALLLAGGLGALQAGAIATALPFSLVLLLGCVGLIKSMRETYSIVDAQEQLQRRHDFAAGLVQTVEEQFPERYGPLVDERIDYRLSRSYERRSDKGNDKRTPGQQS
ncbi:BCCT family transporter [Parenemella sanctibonifatiensis]|uniref:BCCT family transporter n=1 Tax=Parenemella sanctibonifatiensis TaxID=2016505 RepID=UPI00226CBDA1|nr:BCCT family transporter [Parenemella sanctibonifatiensis]